MSDSSKEVSDPLIHRDEVWDAIEGKMHPGKLGSCTAYAVVPARTYKDLKVGDEVFVVQQKSRYNTEERTSVEKVARVGRKYNYIMRGFQELPFCRNTGQSVHNPDHNTRANGQGFDVYLCEPTYRQLQYDAAQKRKLDKRIVGRWNGLVSLPPDIVNKINTLLDEAGLP